MASLTTVQSNALVAYLNRHRQSLGTAGVFASVAGWIALSAQLDLAGAVTARGVGLAAPLLINTALCMPAVYFWIVSSNRRLAPLLALTMVGLMALSASAWHPRKVFLQNLESLKPGMTAAQVDARMAGYRKETNGQTVTYLWDVPAGNYDADLGRVAFQNGRVSQVSFLPD